MGLRPCGLTTCRGNCGGPVLCGLAVDQVDTSFWHKEGHLSGGECSGLCPLNPLEGLEVYLGLPHEWTSVDIFNSCLALCF